MRVLVVRLGALGDIVHTVPAVAALADARPGIEIDWLVDARHRAVLDLFALPVRAIPIHLSGSWRATLAEVRALRARRYEAALDFQGLLKSAVCARASGARRVIGFARAALREPAAAFLYTERVDPGPERHVIAKNLALLGALGVHDDAIRVPLAGRVLGTPAPAGEPRVVLNPGAGWPNKQWAPERFGQLAAAILHAHGLRSVVTWGPGEEDLARAVVAASDGAAEPAPSTTIAGLMEILKTGALVVSGDTGPIHLAAAAARPIVGLYGPTDPARNGPWSVNDITVSRFDACQCHHKRRCRRATRCLDDIAIDDVVRAAALRLGRVGSDGPSR